VEEVVASGIDQIIFVTSEGKSAIENHFDYNFHLDSVLKEKNKTILGEELNNISNLIDIVSVRQKKPLGLGHAIWTARNVIGDEPFMVLLGDDMVLSKTPCAKQLLDLFDEVGESIVAIQKVPLEETSQYGIVEGQKAHRDGTYKVTRMVEKPAPGVSDSNMAIIGRYILMPEIFNILDTTRPGHGGEIQLTDALLSLTRERAMYAQEFEGTRFDAGDKMGYLKAIVAYGLRHPALGKQLKEHLQAVVAAL
jgi:UTP--glucose-1-phosphate uridylyltransferase